MTTKSISVRLPDELYDYLVARAEKEHRTLSNMIIALLTDVLHGAQKWGVTNPYIEQVISMLDTCVEILRDGKALDNDMAPMWIEDAIEQLKDYKKIIG